MRKIEYIFIDSDCQCKPDRHVPPNFGYHFVVNREGLVLTTTDISIPVQLIPGPIYDRDKYNRCSVCIRYCGSLRPEAWLIDADTNCSTILRQRAALLQLLVKLRKHFPDAKILGVSELDGKELDAKNIIVSDSMNVLRRELSDLP
ncbi:MAG: hypothetical protein IKH01_03265 [Prevotella sp.]|nr:hypothetical protein [Prevotella sp.]